LIVNKPCLAIVSTMDDNQVWWPVWRHQGMG